MNEKLYTNFNINTKTSGTGWWSTKKAAVKIHSIGIAVYPPLEFDDAEPAPFGELRAYFDTVSKSVWDTQKDGLIYSDPEWMKTFKAALSTMGFTTDALDDLSYSEQGMQGTNYVSMDIGDKFIEEWNTFDIGYSSSVVKILWKIAWQTVKVVLYCK